METLKSKVVDYASFFTRVAAARQPSAIRALAPLAQLPGMINLGGGLPNASAFPFRSMQIQLAGGDSMTVTAAQMNVALQYGPTPGLPMMVHAVTDLVKRFHRPPLPKNGWSVCTCSGGQDGLFRAFEMVLDESSALLVEDPTYPGALAALWPMGCDLVPVTVDANGLVPDALEKAIRTAKKKVKALYTIPTGQNPCGVTIPTERKKDIYRICRENNILIFEDDPYFFLNFDFFPDPPPSFLSMDVDGRVLRFDSFSKVLSSGIRLGWVTGANPLVDRINLHMQATSLHSSSLSQVIVASLLKQWGPEGFDRHLRSVQSLYRRRRDHVIQCAERHLKGLAEWTVPNAGMFLWMKLHGIEDSSSLVMQHARKRNVLFVPGTSFYSQKGTKSAHVRASYSTASEANLEEAMKRLASLLKDVSRC